MTLFWTIAAGLVVLALAFVVLPLLRRPKLRGPSADHLNLAVIRQQMTELEGDLASGNLDRAQYEAARRDLEKELLLDVTDAGHAERGGRAGRWAVAVVGVGVPVLTLMLYQQIGNPDIIPRLAEARPEAPRGAASTDTPNDHAQPAAMEALVQRLAQRLEQQPDDLEGWLMLARSYLAFGRLEDALAAYEKAYQLAPERPDLLLSYAQILARANNNRLAGRPAELVEAALALAPEDPNALWLGGVAAYEERRFADAESRWMKVLPMLQPGSEEEQQVRGAINEVRSQIGLPTLPATTQVAQETAAPGPRVQPPAAQTPSPATATSGSSLSVEVDLAPGLRDRLGQGDLVFVFAQLPEGPRMPLAVARHPASDLPLQVTLDDGSAMSPQFKLSAFDQVMVGARISRNGSANPQSGDLEGAAGPVQPGQADPVRVIIDKIRP